MANASRDNNRVTTLLAVSSTDGVTPVPIYADPTTHRLLVSATTQIATGLITAGTNITITGSGTSASPYVINSSGGSALTVGTTTIASGTNTRVLFDNSGVLGEYTISGSGSVAMTTSPTFVTPTLGAATATTINKLTLTQPATGSTLTIADGKTLTANNSITIAGTDSTTMTFPSTSDTVVTLGATQTLTNKTLTTPVINGLPTGTGVASAATASTLASRDSNANSTVNNLLEGYTTTATAAGTTTLTVASTYQQFFTGSNSQTVVLPVTSTLVLGQSYIINNNSSAGNVTVQSSGANTISVVPPMSSAVFTCILTSGTTAASWTTTGILTGSFSTTFTFNGSGGTTGSVTVNYQRIGSLINLFIPTVTGTTGTSSTSMTANTAIPDTFARPLTNTQSTSIYPLINNGAALAGPGQANVSTGGIITIFKDATGAAFTNSSTCGIGGNMVTLTYFVGVGS